MKGKIINWLRKVRNRRHYKKWKVICSGALPIHYVKRFNPWGSKIFYNRIEEWECKSGRIGLWKKTNNPVGSGLYDGTDHVPCGFLDDVFSFIGYKNEKLIKECSFQEYLSIYGKTFSFSPSNL